MSAVKIRRMHRQYNRACVRRDNAEGILEDAETIVAKAPSDAVAKAALEAARKRTDRARATQALIGHELLRVLRADLDEVEPE